VVALYRLLRRFIRGEEPVGDLYLVVIDSLDVLLGELSNRRLAELKAEVEILARLGYVDAEAVPKTLQGLALTEVATMTDPKLEVQLEILVGKARENSHL
jgi:hypothetical protein